MKLLGQRHVKDGLARRRKSGCNTSNFTKALGISPAVVAIYFRVLGCSLADDTLNASTENVRYVRFIIDARPANNGEPRFILNVFEEIYRCLGG